MKAQIYQGYDKGQGKIDVALHEERWEPVLAMIFSITKFNVKGIEAKLFELLLTKAVS